ncbi:MAG: ABC transporter permease, partial [Clostridia bacterium]|nr:ABC transporter permease [Clostridia bacterium]
MNRNQNRKGRTPSGVLTIVRKELHRFFGDRRMLMTVLLPGIIIYVVYSLMGSTMMSSLMGDTETPYTMQVENLPASVKAGLEAVGEASGTTVETVTEESDPKAAVADGKLDIYVVFPTDFDELVAAYDPASGLPAPAVEIYYNSSEPRSQSAYALVASVLDAYESALANRMDINPDPSVSYDLAAPEDITEMLFSMLMPMLLLVLMFSGCMAMTTESIAGEKERGTIATLLVTPVRRWELALGKIAALSVMSLLAGLCSFAGVILALPKLMGGEEMGMADASIYTLGDYGMILCVILSTVLLFVSLIAVLSALA